MRRIRSLSTLLLLASALTGGSPVLAAGEVPPVAAPATPFPNSPVGDAKGIFPGRVTWVRDVNATPWDGKTGKWWEAGNINEEALAAMFSKSVRGLTGGDPHQDDTLAPARLRQRRLRRPRGQHGGPAA